VVKEKNLMITYILVSGGHAAEAMKIAAKLNSKVSGSYIVFKGDATTKHHIPNNDAAVEIPECFREIRYKNIAAICHGFLWCMPCLFKSIWALKKLHTDLVIATGSGPALIPLLAAKILHRKIVFIELTCRVKTLSLCGWLAYYFFADLFFVQWNSLQKKYPRSIYAGRLV